LNEIHQFYQVEINTINAQVFDQINYLKQVIDAKDKELIVFKTNIQTVLNSIFQQKSQQQPLSANQQPFSQAVQQKIKQEEINKATYLSDLLNAIKKHSNGKPNAPSV